MDTQPDSLSATINAITYAVSNLGFPIFVAVYLLLRFEKVISNLTVAVNNLTALVANLSEFIKLGPRRPPES